MYFYLESLPIEVGLGPIPPLWTTFLTQIETFFRRLILVADYNYSSDCSAIVFKLMILLIRTPGINQVKVNFQIFIYNTANQKTAFC